MDQEAWELYPRTVLELGAGVRVDLRRPLGDLELQALRSLDLGEPFAVLTPENPRGDSAEEAGGAERWARERSNDRRLETLEAELGAGGVPFRRVDGVAPEGHHRERCLAVAVAREEAVALARRFGQLALFWFDGERFWLLPASLEEEPRPLPARPAP